MTVVASEAVTLKAARYLASGRISVLELGPDHVEAQAQGEEMYRLGYTGGAWWCSCPARRICAHVLALRLVVEEPEDRRG